MRAGQVPKRPRVLQTAGSAAPLLKQPRGPGALASPPPAQERPPRSCCLAWRCSLSGLFSSLHSALLPCGLHRSQPALFCPRTPSTCIPAVKSQPLVQKPGWPSRGARGPWEALASGRARTAGVRPRPWSVSPPGPCPPEGPTLLWLGHVVACPPGSRASLALSPVPLFPPSALYTHEQGCLPLRPLAGPQTPRRGPPRGHLRDAGPRRMGWDWVGSGLGSGLGSSWGQCWVRDRVEVGWGWGQGWGQG